MKNILFLLLSLLSFSHTRAQSLSPKVLSAAGGTYSNSTASLSFTIGEMPLVNTATGPGFFLTQGFQQGMACEFDGYNAFSDTISICGDSVILDGGNGFIDYDWNTGGKTQRIVVKQNGWYRITVTNNAGCTAQDSTYVSLVAANITQKDTTICRNAELTLSVNSGIGTASALKDLPQNLQNGLVAWYPFSGNANDYSGNGYSGTVNGASLTTDRFGLNNGAYSFDGRSYIVTSSNLNLLPLGKTNRSFSLWMKSNITTDPPNRDMFNWGTYLTSQRFGFTMYSARSYFVGQNNDFYGNGNIGDNLWHHVIVTYDGTRVVIYIDGLYNAAATKNLNTQVPQVIIGRSPLNHPAPTYFNGQMDDIFIYNRVLSESEIQQLYSPKQKILWSTGDTTSSIAVKPAQTNTYYVTVTDGITICRDSVRVTVFDPVSYNPLPDKTIASSDSVILDAGAGYTRYQWSNGSSARNITVRSTGLYKVTVTTPQGCIATDSSFVQFADTVGVFIPVVNAVCNMPVDVPIKAYKFRNMLTMQGSINWDTSGLRFESVSNFGPPAMSMGAVNFGTTQTSEGRIAFSWNDAIVKGVTLSDSTTLFVLRFMPIGSTSKRITVNIVNSPTPLEFIDINYNKQVTIIRNGEIHLTCDGIVAGRIITPLDQGIPNVVLTLAGTDSTKATMTDRDGNYSLRAVSGSYILAPGKNNEKYKTNGISTMDIAMIQSHILQKDLLNSPFKIIAGDANSSGTVSTADLLYIRRMVLNVDTSFPGNKTWAFVDANHTFSNPQNPFPYPSNKTFTNFSGNMSQSFRAIKLGDVNFDRNPLLDNPQGLKDTLRLYYETTTLKDNGTVIVQLRVKDVKNLLGFQYTVNWDKHKLLYQGIGANPLNISVGEGWVDDGYLVLSWNDPEAGGIQLKEGDLLFELNYHTYKNFDKARLGISSDKVSTEVFNSQYELLELRLEASDILKPQELASVKFKIYPNPAETVINVQWIASVEGVGYIHLFDLSGRKVYEEKVNVNAGDNKFSLYLNKGRFARGTYVLQLTSEKNVYVKKVKIGNE